MLLDPYCFIRFLEDNNVPVLEYIDNWAEGEVRYYFFNEALVIDMQECIHVEVARMYLRKIRAEHLALRLKTLDCPCFIKGYT
jgi:hypothetical protein